MVTWSCGLGDCDATFDGVEGLLVHQVDTHPSIECAVCHAQVPDGFYAIRHVFTEHSRARYVRHYDGDADAIRYRENLIEDVEERVDPDAILENADSETPTQVDTSAVSAGD